MKNKKAEGGKKQMKKGSFVSFILVLALLTGCNSTDNNSQQSSVQQDSADYQNSQGQQMEADSGTGQRQEPQAEAQQTGQQSGNTEAEFGFEALADRVFYFSSGVGAWHTELYINSDGTFEGMYQDANMGDNGEDYPHGTEYYCNFTGKFDNLEKVDEFTYKMKLVSLLYEEEPDKEEIIDGIRFIYSTAYGLTGGTDFFLYLPGATLTDLPEGYRAWVGYYYLEDTTETELPFYGLYNVSEENGFSSSVYEQQSLAERIAMEISFAEESGAELEAQIQEASSQGDMNAAGAELFRTWDDTLNIVWKLLESELDAETMEVLRAEEREWIAIKDEAVKAAGQEFEGGSLQPMAEAMKAAELTKERVYELAEYAQ
ncbi:MAG: DUF1311 domain-containing protein [Lachnospiraceae bacterium]|nr:DUF1311 domain-containing protein [Lachnospiraceae bacterium]